MPEAADYFREALTYALQPDLDSPTHLNLGWVVLDSGDLTTAGTHMHLAVRGALRGWDPIFLAPALLGLAC